MILGVIADDFTGATDVASMLVRETQPRVLAVRSFTVLKVDSIGFVVLMCFQCGAGKS